MTDGMMWGVLIVMVFSIVIYLLMRNGDYNQQYILSPGTYEVGIEIPPGRCDLMAESGGGNFNIKNRNSNAWSLGNAIGNSGVMPNRFRNVTLKRGDILQINGNVRVMLSPPVPITDLKNETLGPGIYRFGVDVPPAKYDFEIASGSGEVILVDIRTNTYDFFQDMAAGHPQRAKSYDNVVCSRRYDLWVNGTLQVKLKRSRYQFSRSWFPAKKEKEKKDK